MIIFHLRIKEKNFFNKTFQFFQCNTNKINLLCLQHLPIHFNLKTEEKHNEISHDTTFINITLLLTGRMKCKPKDKALCQNVNFTQ